MTKKIQNRGITLIALVITVIVLLTLAGVTLNFVIGENGILKHAEFASNRYKNTQIEENTILADYENKIEQYSTMNIEGTRGQMGKLLWTGEWRDGAITVDKIRDYTVCVAVDGDGGFGLFEVQSGKISTQGTYYETTDSTARTCITNKLYTIENNTLTTTYGSYFQLKTNSSSWTSISTWAIQRNTDAIVKIYGLF